MSLQDGPDRRRRGSERSNGCYFAAETARRGLRRPLAKGQSGNPSLAGREEFPGKSGRRGDGLSGLMASVWNGADPERLAENHRRPAKARAQGAHFTFSPRRPEGEGRVRGADRDDRGAAHLTFPPLRDGPLPLPPKGRRGAFASLTDVVDLRRSLQALGLATVLLSAAAAAQQPSEALPLSLPTVEVVGATPLLGSGVDRDKVPAETQVLTDRDISRNGYPQMLPALEENVPGVTLDNAAGNPFQPNLLYHGFVASPLQGNPQGLAVYLNGVRFNQPFGDTVNWDLIPDIAIDRVDLVGSNPVFGLNALGGALSVRTKNGFTYHGGEIDILGGSFSHYQGELQYGVQSGNTAVYVAATGLHEGGWRDLQSSNVRNFHGDIGWRGSRAEAHLNVTAADNTLNGPGTSPIELLAVDPSALFTAPNLIKNRYALVTASGTYDVTDTTSLQGVAYYEYFLQQVANGNVPVARPCTDQDQAGFLCVAPGAFATNRAGNPIPDFLNGGPYSDLDQQSTNTNGYGASVQVTNRDERFGHPNQLVAGFSFDGARILFSGSTQIGGLSLADRVFAGPGTTIDQADGSIAPVRVGISNAYYGLFFTDTLDVTPELSANLAGRFNLAQIDLTQQG